MQVKPADRAFASYAACSRISSNISGQVPRISARYVAADTHVDAPTPGTSPCKRCMHLEKNTTKERRPGDRYRAKQQSKFRATLDPSFLEEVF